MSKKCQKIITSMTLAVIILVWLLVIVPLLIVSFVFNRFVNKRFEPEPIITFTAADYPDLKAIDYSYNSNFNQRIYAQVYAKVDVVPKALIIYAHGFLVGGHYYYLPGINFLAENNFAVIGYDVSGNGKSNEVTQQGFAQGIIDLEYLIKKVKADPKLSQLPLFLLGHSWGGYAVGAVLNVCPDVAGVISLCGFNSVTNTAIAVGTDNGGEFADVVPILSPYLRAYNFLKFGRYAGYTALNGFKKSKVPALIVTSQNDSTIPQSDGYALFFNHLKNDKRFTFLNYGFKSHEFIDRVVDDELVSIFFKDYQTTFFNRFNFEFSVTLRKCFGENMVDKAIFAQVDTVLYDHIITFINKYLETE